MKKSKGSKSVGFAITLGLVSVLFVIILFFFWNLPDVSDLKTKNPMSTALMVQRYREARNSDQKFRLRQQWVELERIPKLLKDTVRVTEDAAFYQHKGVDFAELKIALKKSWEEGKLVRGASTITQQLAKNLYLSNEKSVLRKIKEYFIARRLEKTLTKSRIFHLYLNVIEFGPGIFGVQAASQYYFQKEVDQLVLEEIVRLTAVIPKPLIENPTGKSRWLKWKARWILDTLKKNNYISPKEYQLVITTFQ